MVTLGLLCVFSRSSRGLPFKHFPLVWSVQDLFGVRYGFIRGQPLGHLNPLNSSVKLIHLFFLRPESPSRVHSKYMCRDIWLFFSSDMGLLFKSVSSLIVRYRLARHGRPEIDLYPDLDLRSVKLGQVGTVCTRLIFLQKILRLQSSIHKFIVN